MTQPQPVPEDLAIIDLDRTDQGTKTMSFLASVVAIERDRVRTGSIWIGDYVGKRGKWLGLVEVRPNATWDRKPTGYRLKVVTSVSINNYYLTALAAIATEAPTETN